MILRRNSIKKTRKSRVFRFEFRVSKLQKANFFETGFESEF
jgi:hypothetical protein